MKTLIVLYYLVCYSINLLNLSLLGLLLARQRTSVYLRELLFMLGLMVISVNLSLPNLFPAAYQNFAETPTAVMFIFATMSLVGICLVTASTPAYIHSFRPTRTGRVASLLGLAAGALSLTVTLSELFLTGQSRLLVYCFGLMVAAVAWSVAWFLVQMVRHRQAVLAHDSARVGVVMSLLTLVFMPLIVMVDFLNLSLPFLPQLADMRITILPLFLAIWSALLLWKNAGRLAAVPAILADPQACVDDAACAELSEREKDVLKQLVQGLSYNEIADKLCISHSTVKTHVRRIYQKTGVSSRFALISRLKAADHPKG